MSAPGSGADGPAAAVPGGPHAARVVAVVNKRGLHARAAARFVKLAGQFAAQVSVAKGDAVVSGNSIMGLMMLAAGKGSAIEIRASGNEAASALDALSALVAGKFDEE